MLLQTRIAVQAKAHLPLLCGIIFFLSPTMALAEEIGAYTVHVEMNTNGSLAVQEEIVYDFGEGSRHGIYRYIPLVYRTPNDLNETRIELSSIMVTDGKGNLVPTQYSGGGNYAELKIGDPDKLVTGVQFYVIRYTVWGAIKFSPYYDELYWDITGTSWTHAILRTRAEFVLPRPISKSAVSWDCFVGNGGKRVNNCASSSTTTGLTADDIALIRFDHGELRAHEGMSALIKIPKGVIWEMSSDKQKEQPMSKDFLIFRKAVWYSFLLLLGAVIFPIARKEIKKRRPSKDASRS